MASEVDSVGDITDEYLRTIYTETYPDLITFTTALNGTKFNLNAPYEMNYYSQIAFPAQAISFPSQDELDALLSSSFETPQVQAYVDLLNVLPDANIFSTTSNVTSQITTVRSSPRFAWVTVTAVSGCTIFIFIVGGGLYLRNNSSSAKNISDDEFDNLIYGKRRRQTKKVGTVTGDTVEGSATVWSGTSGRRTASDRIVEENPYLEEEGYSTNGSEWMTRDGHPSASNSVHDFGEHRLDDDDIDAIGSLLEANRLESEHKIKSNDGISEGSTSMPNYDDGLKRASMHGLDTPAVDANNLLSTNGEQTSLNSHVSAGLDNFSDDYSVDESVPLRVVDLIKRFSPN
jgi:hypothetical protein